MTNKLLILRTKLFLSSILAASICFPLLAEEPAKAVNTKENFTIIGDNFSTECGRGTCFSYSSNKKTYVVWPGPGMSPQIRAIDETTGEISPIVRIRELNYSAKSDYHDYPSMVAGKDGTLHVFMTKHVRQLHYFRSAPGGDIGAPWTETIFPDPAGYPYSLVASDGTLFIFYNWNMDPKYVHPERPLYFRRSDDGGKTWSKPVKCMDRDIDDMKELYVGAIKLEPAQGKYPERVNIVLTLAGRGGHNQCHKDIYYAYMDVNTQTMYDVSGADLGDCISGADEWNKIKVLDTGDSYKTPYAVHHTHNVTADAATGNPLVGYEQYKDDPRKYYPTVQYWNGEKWNQPVFTPKGLMFCDMFRDPRGMFCYVREAGTVTGYVYSAESNSFTEAGTFKIDGLSIASFRLTGGYSGYEPARFVFHEKCENIKEVVPKFRVGIYNGK
ncbi:MAG TPA: hypothetical protein DET40_18210 [Lentisphaeria bacterium]|nr:MAG: hypothetical protein A2X45_25010 [Lentisphaerae bacterium GWF2_50_93]HCE45478.1 hypothetical protein [Lentisphaeria bacterium]